MRGVIVRLVVAVFNKKVLLYTIVEIFIFIVIGVVNRHFCFNRSAKKTPLFLKPMLLLWHIFELWVLLLLWHIFELRVFEARIMSLKCFRED